MSYVRMKLIAGQVLGIAQMEDAWQAVIQTGSVDSTELNRLLADGWELIEVIKHMPGRGHYTALFYLLGHPLPEEKSPESAD